jgi:hypothetical protein
MIDIGWRAGHRQVMEDHIAVVGEPVQQAGGVLLAVGAALPGADLLRGPEPQPPADQRRDRQAEQPRLRQAGLGGEDLDGDAGDGDQRRPPSQAAGPGGQLLGAAPPVGGQGGAARAAQARGESAAGRRCERAIDGRDGWVAAVWVRDALPSDVGPYPGKQGHLAVSRPRPWRPSSAPVSSPSGSRSSSRRQAAAGRRGPPRAGRRTPSPRRPARPAATA